MKRRLSCKNCKAVRYPIKQRGLCPRCYEATEKIQELYSWNPSDESTLKGYPRGVPLFPTRIIAKMKGNAMADLKRDLKKLKLEEKWRQQPASSISIEYQLRWLAERAGSRSSGFLHGIAIFFDGLSQEQKDTLYDILKSIEGHLPSTPFRWRPFD